MSSKIFTKREYLSDVVTASVAGSFAIRKYPLNVGLYQTAPWLSAIAAQFINYRVLSYKVSFIPTIGTAVYNAASNPAMGQVGIRFQRDPTVAAETDLFQVNNVADKTTGLPYNTQTKVMGPGRAGNLLIRQGVIPPNQDPRFFDFGYFLVYSSGLPAASLNIGQLWVDYEIELSNATMNGGLIGIDVLEDQFESATGQPWNGVNFWGTAGVITANATNTIGCSLTGSTIKFPSYLQTGTFKIVTSWVGTTDFPSTGFTALPTVSSELALVTDNQTSSNFIGNTITQSTRMMHLIFTVQITNPLGTVPTITFSVINNNIGTCNTNVWIMQVNRNIV